MITAEPPAPILLPRTLHTKNKRETAATLRERLAADCGLLTKNTELVLDLLLVGSAVVGMWWITGCIAAVLLVDFFVYVGRRQRMLSFWGAGTPRLMTAEDFHAADDAFRLQDRSAPTMSDYEEAMGFSDRPEWREALRYQELIHFSEGGTVVDIGCGDGRLCWKYNICSPENYFGVDSGTLVQSLIDRTSGKAHAIKGVAEATALPSECADLVVCTEVFEHLSDPEIAMREFCRILRPGGRIVIQSPSAVRLRNLNPFHMVTIFLGHWFPSLLQRTVVHENTFIAAFTYHWDFTRQDFKKLVHGLPLGILSLRGATYHFNPHGNILHRLAYRISHLPVINSLWGDLTVVLRKC